MLKVQFPFNQEGGNIENENNEVVENQNPVDSVQEPAPVDEPTGATSEATEAPQEPTTTESTPAVETATEEAPTAPEVNYVQWYNEEFGTSFESLEDLKQTVTTNQEAPKPTSESEDPQMAAFKRFQDETGKGMEEFVQLSKNWSEVDTLTAVRNLVVEEHKPLTLKPRQIDALIEKKYGVDISDGIEDMDDVDVMQLQLDAEKYKLTKKEEYDKYFTPTQQPEPNQSAESVSGDEVVVNGQRMSKGEYEELRQAYLTERSNALKEIKEVAFGITIDDNGEKKPMDFKYVYTDEDRAFASSLSEDISQIPEQFLKEGRFQHQDFNEGLIWMFPENREKLLKPLLEAAFAAGVDQTLKESRNVNFSQSRAANPEPVRSGVDVGTIKRTLGGGPSIKFHLNPKN